MDVGAVSARRRVTYAFAHIGLYSAIIAIEAGAISWVSPRFFLIPSEVAVFFAIQREGMLCAMVISASAIMAMIERCSFWSFGLSGSHRGANFIRGAFAGIAFLSILIGCLAATHHLVLQSNSGGFASALLRLPLWIIGFFLVAMTEELLFRGYAQTTLSELIGFWPAAVVLSLIFGLVHLRNSGEGLLGVVVVILGGALFSLALKRTGSLWWGIGFHTAWDWGQSFLFGTRDSGILISDRLLQSSPRGAEFLSGGSTGPEGSAFVIPVFILALCFVSFTLGRENGVLSKAKGL